MDPATIATSVVTILAPYIADAGKQLVKSAGEAGLEQTKRLLASLKQQFKADPAAEKDLSRFEQNPQAFKANLTATIEEKIRQDPRFASEVERRVRELGPTLAIIQRLKEGKDVIGVDADAVRSGSVSVTQDADKVERLTGVRSKTIG